MSQAHFVHDDFRRFHEPAVLTNLHNAAAVARAVELGLLAEMPDDMVFKLVCQPQLFAAAGTYSALRAAADGQWAGNLSGGYHHARRNLSHGFCLINDVAVSMARLRYEGIRRRTLIVDLDLHLGDGNATAFTGDSDIYTLSIHEQDIFPFPKMTSDLDIGLPSYTGDDEYLAAVDDALTHAARHFEPEVIVYVAGSDPYAGDPLGSLQISRAGLLARDRFVAAFAKARYCALVVLPAGGYTRESPAIHAAGFGAIDGAA